MAKDIAPELLEKLQKSFSEKLNNNKKINEIYSIIGSGEPTYTEINDLSIVIGDILAEVFGENLSADILPDGRMYYNIAKRTIEPMMIDNYNIVTDNAVIVQEILNKQAGIGIKAQIPALNQSRIDGIIDRLDEAEFFDDIKWILDEPIKNFTQAIVDDTVRINAEFQANEGLSPKIIRKVDNNPCGWCKNLAGEYDYYEVIDQGNDVFKRHDYCRCTVIFDNSAIIHSGSRGRRKYVKDKYGGYELSKKERIRRAEEMAKTEKARKEAARKKRIETWARKNASK